LLDILLTRYVQAVQQRTATCQKIFDQFESVPGCIHHAECLQNMHRKSHSLNTAIRNLYLQLVKCLPALIQILLREEKHSRRCTKCEECIPSMALTDSLPRHEKIWQRFFQRLSSPG
jgi:hypothetical protein